MIGIKQGPFHLKELPQNIFSPFLDLLNTSLMERMNKAMLYLKIRFLETRKEDFQINPKDLALTFQAWNIPLCTYK